MTYNRHRGRAESLVADIAAADRRPTTLACGPADAAATQAELRRVDERLGALHILAHSAGTSVGWAPVRELEPAQFPGMLEADLIGAYNEKVTGQAIASTTGNVMCDSKRRRELARTSPATTASTPPQGHSGEGSKLPS